MAIFISNQKIPMKLRISLFTVPATAALLFGSSAAIAADKNSAELVPLKLYRNLERADYFDTSTEQGEKDAKNGNYEFVRTEAYVFANPRPGTVPLKLYWIPERHEHDYFLIATPQSENDAKSAGYQFVRIEGYVYPEPRSGTVPLKRYWKGNDNFFTAVKQGEKDAFSEGYQFVRIEGYAIRDHQAFLGDRTVDYVPMIAQRRGLNSKEIVLNGDDRLDTPISFKPPVEITLVAKTDSTNLRIGYAADQVIFNWEMDPKQLRVEGGPAGGKYNSGAGLIPADKFVTVKWIVTDHQQSIYVDGHLKFLDVADYSDINRPVSVFPALHSTVTVKSLTVKRLPETAVQEIETRDTAATTE
jgi:hypothetical protein